ncbi:MAG: hypothetical protein IPK13_10805 [Deltaproteobacteria bacterium]|nr:hypothetical protein [Deltaproteobacteria bacterium]
MGFLRSILRFFGLSGEARVRVRAPGIEITILGDPRRVRWVLDAVKLELERNPRYRSLPDRARFRKEGNPRNVVQPTELDEKDSPYAVPGAMVIPVRGRVETEEEPTDAPREHTLSNEVVEWSSEGSFEIAEEETPADFENPFGSEETVNDSRPDRPSILPRRLTPDIRPTEEIEAYTEARVRRASSDPDHG